MQEQTARVESLDEVIKSMKQDQRRLDKPELPQVSYVDQVDSIINERQSTHGDFTDNARTAQGLKRVLWNEKGWDELSDVQREAVEMIMLKVSRIITGNQDEPDHWNDIAGYAKLASQRIGKP